jgi:ligand-binding sensor domain-containing protein
MWVGTDGGLNRLDRTAGQFTRFVNDPANPHSLSNNSIWDIYEDHAGVLWLATDVSQMQKNPQTNISNKKGRW